MGLQITGVEELLLRLQRAEREVLKGAVDQMREEAKGIRDLARKMAPVDEGDLEKAIKYEEQRGRDARGRFAATTFLIGVDSTVVANSPNREGQKIKVGDYAYIMHEHLTPYGRYNLGPKSQAKQSGQQEMVGGKFLERAAAEKEQGLVNRMLTKVRDLMD